MSITDFAKKIAREKATVIKITGEDEEPLDQWVKHLSQEREVRTRTISDYMTELARFAQWWGKPLDQLTKDDAIAYKTHIRDKYKTPENWLNGPRMYLKFRECRHNEDQLWDTSYLPSICRSLRIFRRNGNGNGQSVRETPVLTIQEVEKLIEVAAKFGYSDVGLRDSCLIALLYSTGFRTHEFLAMRMKDLWLETTTNEKGEEVSVWKAHCPVSKTMSRTIDVVWGFEYAELWKAHRAHAEPDDPLWVPTRAGGLKSLNPILSKVLGEAPKTVQDKFRRAGKEAHLFRHTRATHLAHEWKDPWLLRDYFGWRSLAMPNHYVHAVKGAKLPPQIPPAKTIECECGYKSIQSFAFCPGCGRALSKKAKESEKKEVLINLETIKAIKEELKRMNERLAKLEE